MTRQIKGTGIHTLPPSSVMAEGDVRAYLVRVSDVLGEEQALDNPLATLTDQDSGELVVDGASVDSNDETSITLRVAGLTVDHTYELWIMFDHDPPRVDDEHTDLLHIIQCLG